MKRCAPHDALESMQTIADRLMLPRHYLNYYANTAAKIDLKALELHKELGKVILVTGITPTPSGEGKTVSTIGLSDGLRAIGLRSIACIRQPSLGPTFGAKGGASGGGAAQVVPVEQLSFHLTGDIHAISAAHNLAAAAIDARLYHETRLGDRFTALSGLQLLSIDPQRILWHRVIDHNDRALREIALNPSGSLTNEFSYKSGFAITAASELMAILALAEGFSDLRTRIGKVILALDIHGNPITAEKLEVAGAMAALMKASLSPTLMQTREGTPVLVHAGPFANIAHGNSSIIADRMGRRFADYVVTEAGFGSDMGMEKYFNIKGRISQIMPSCVVMVCTLRSLKAHSGEVQLKFGNPAPPELFEPQQAWLEAGISNLGWHIKNAQRYGVPIVVAINRFEQDTEAELAYVASYAKAHGVQGVAVNEAFIQGGQGAKALARAVTEAIGKGSDTVNLLYKTSDSLIEKLTRVTTIGYGASEVGFTQSAQARLAELTKQGYGALPVCIAKTPFSLSTDPKRKGVPSQFVVTIEQIHLNAGAGFIVAYTSGMVTMPGLGIKPAYRNIELSPEGVITGI